MRRWQRPTPMARQRARSLPRRVRLEYALAAEPGERMEIVTWQDEAVGRAVRSEAADGTDLLRARLGVGIVNTTLRASVVAIALFALVAGCGGSTESSTLGTITETEAPSLAPTAASASASASTSSAFDLVEYPVTAGSHPHDVAPARRRRRLVHGQHNGDARPPRPDNRGCPRDRARGGLGAARRDRRAGRRRRGSPTAA